MLVIIVKTYMQRHRIKISPLDILKDNTELFKLFNNCCVETECDPMDGSYNIQTSFDSIIQFFKDYCPQPKSLLGHHTVLSFKMIIWAIVLKKHPYNRRCFRYKITFL